MEYSSPARSNATARDRPRFPAYGPIDAVLGLVLFYIVVDRATPTVVDVFGSALPNVSSTTVELGLALFLWFVVAVTIVEQLRRQLVALAVLESDQRESVFADVLPWDVRTGGYAVMLVAGGLLAWLTFETGVETAIELIRIVATLDTEAFLFSEFIVMVLFFVSFSIATHSLDRLVIDGIRTLLRK